VRTFADQAVIAIENARLFEQTKEALRKLEVRSSELDESLQHQTATSQILSVISSSKTDIQPVFDAIVDTAARLFEPCGATITSLRDGRLHWTANAATLPDFDIKRARAKPGRRRFIEQLQNPLVGRFRVDGLLAWPRLVLQPFKAKLRIAMPPKADNPRLDPNFLGD